MIAIIGFKRIVILAIFLSIALVLGGLNFGFISPQLLHVETEQDRAERELRALRADLTKIQIEFDQLDKQKSDYEDLLARDFFSNQDRSEVKKLFTRVQREARVISSVVNVKSGVIEDNPIAAKADHKILMSQVEVEVSALEDGDIYKYFEMLIDRFPGHLRVDLLTVQRTRDINAAILRRVASGSSIAMVEAKALLSWRTMIPDSLVTDSIK